MQILGISAYYHDSAAALLVDGEKVAKVLENLLTNAYKFTEAGTIDVRVRAAGLHTARRWAWRQALGSAPALLRRGWWRGGVHHQRGKSIRHGQPNRSRLVCARRLARATEPDGGVRGKMGL